MAMFIVFEGIDGSGKTTLSNRVAKTLAASGLRVEHVREGGTYSSQVAQSLRELGRDVRNLALAPEAELLLLAAREAQIFEESTRPALARADVVIADRFFHSAEVLAARGRGLDEARVRAVLQAASGGVEPDLVFLADADPHLARARRRVAKLQAPPGSGTKGPSRKNLAGAGLQRLLRDGYRALAAREPQRWIVVENTDEPLEDLEERVTAWARIAVHLGAAAAVRSARAITVAPAPPAPLNRERAATAFLAWIDRRSATEPAVAAHVLAGMSGPLVDERRVALAQVAPAVVADGLTGLDDGLSWELRAALAAVVPHHVARSLRGAAALDPRSRPLRLRLAALAPAETARSLAGLDDDESWALRQILSDTCHDAVVASLARIDTDHAWVLRSRETSLAALVASVRGLDGDPAWAIRERALAAIPVDAIESLAGLTSDRAWEWRQRLAARAPRVVMKTLTRSEDPRAWALRESLAPLCTEAVDSIQGLDSERAWRMREAYADRWPSTVVKSLAALASTPRGAALLDRQLAKHPADVSLLKHAVAQTTHRLTLEAAPAPATEVR